MGKAIAYLRVSTQRQHRSGLGIEAQRAAVTRFGEAEGITIIGEFVEAETGKGADALDRRPQLAAALAVARSAKCCVVVSKLDRLSPDVAFVSGLIAQRVPFIVAELVGMPILSCCTCVSPIGRGHSGMSVSYRRSALNCSQDPKDLKSRFFPARSSCEPTAAGSRITLLGCG
jgi:hypothetical protein